MKKISIGVATVVVLGLIYLYSIGSTAVKKEEVPPVTPTAQVAPATAPAAVTGNLVLSLGGNKTLGAFLVGVNGMTLYTFTKDTPGKSACYGPCLKIWQPLVTSKLPIVASVGILGKLGVIDRTDGVKQVTYNGAPLYFWSGDKKPGDATGNNFKGIWFVAKP